MTLQQLREEKGVTVTAAAARLGTTYQGVRRIEKTGRTLTTTLLAYADAIGAGWHEVCDACRETIRAEQTPLTISSRRSGKVLNSKFENPLDAI